MNYYRFDTLGTAQAALAFINNHEVFPVVGENAATHEASPTKQQTTKWCDGVLECLDGKFAFPQVPTEKLDQMGINEDQRALFIATFDPTIEPYDEAWVPEPEESE